MGEYSEADIKSEVKLRTGYSFDNVDVALGEYFEEDVK